MFHSRWLLSILIAAVVGLVALLTFRNDLIAYMLKPPGEFDRTQVPTAPDYSQLAFWPAHPQRDDPSDQVPAGEPAPQHDLAADLFFIHPTGYVRAKNWNSDMAPGRSAAFLTDVWLATQASAFNQCCHIYAPEYRQAALYAFVDRDTRNGRQALELAYEDVLRAFDHYLAHDNQGRPFILASHSQGTAHALRLLAERIENSDAREQLVAAYLLGYQLPLDTFTRNLSSLKPCTDARDTGCIIAWDTFRTGYEWPVGVPHWYGDHWEWSEGKPILCTNPLSWKPDTVAAKAQQNLGALPLRISKAGLSMLLDRNVSEGIGKFPALLPAHTGAACKDGGVLQVDEQHLPAFQAGERLLGKGNYHVSDFTLFYKNIQQNAQVRVAQFLEQR